MTLTSIDKLFFALKTAAPHRVAARCGDVGLTYGELDARSDDLAELLAARGVGAEVLVVLPAERSLEALVGIVGTWKAGGAFLPLDPAHPAGWIAQVVEQANPRLLLVGRHLHDSLRKPGLPEVRIPTGAAGQAYNPAPRDPAALAYCNFTSGSSGPPKGVMVSDGSLMNQALALCPLLAIRSGEHVLQATPLVVDSALEEILPTLLSGGTLIVPEFPLEPGPELTRFVAVQQIGVVSLATSLWKQWLDHRKAEEWERPLALRMVFVGGERVHAQKLKDWYKLPWTHGIEWVTDYGPTEATISCTIWPGAKHFAGDDVPIGAALEGVRIYVLDDSLAAAEPGQTGTLWLGGAAPARGYLGRPRLTAEMFRPDPWGEAGARIYCSGDLGWRDQAGQFHFSGRSDEQLKVFGHRLEPGLIEDHLMRLCGLREAAVIAIEHPRAGPELVAFVSADHVVSSDKLRQELAALLPPVMVPGRIEQIDRIPRAGPMGKVDKRRLRELAIAKRPASSAGSRLLQIWTEAVGRKPLRSDEGFFAAGGNSLGALRMLQLLREDLCVDLNFAQVAACGSIADLERLVSEADTVPSARDGLQMPRLRGQSYPLSQGQSRLWFLEQQSPDTVNYSLPLVFEIEGSVDPSRFDAALAILAARHETLRSVFRKGDEGPAIAVAPRLELTTQWHQAGNRDGAIELVRDEMRRPFDLAGGPLVRSCMVQFGPAKNLWLFNAHHAILDAWSLDILIGELSALLDGRELPPVVGNPEDRVLREAQFLEGGASRERAYWRSAMSGTVPALKLARRAAPLADAVAGGLIPFRIAAADASLLREAAQRQGTSVFAVTLAAYAAALYRWTMAERFVLGVPAACRSDRRDADIVGYLVNTLPVVVDIADRADFGSLTQQLGRRLAEGIAHQALPLDEILACAESRLPHGADGLVRNLFVMHDTPAAAPLELAGCRVRELALHNGSAKMDSTVTLRSEGEDLAGTFEFATSVFSPAQAQSFLDLMMALLRAGIATPDIAIDCLATQSKTAARDLVLAANRSCQPSAPFQSFIGEFLQRAADCPDQPALEDADKAVTYRELEAASAQAASALQGGGVGSDVLVGVCMERSIDCIVALLGVLRAGGAFVPMLPSAPPARNVAIAAAAGLEHVIADISAAQAFAGLPLRTWRAANLRAPTEFADRPVHPSQLAYCYFTSGSTGVPKGVGIDHQCAAVRLNWLRAQYVLGPGNALIHKTPLIFDVAIWEIFAPLAEGALVLIAGPRVEADPFGLVELIERPEVVAVHFVPSLLDAFLSAVPDLRAPALRHVQLSGEAPSVDLVRRARDVFGCRIDNCYGQTETSEVAAWTGGDLGGRVPIGVQAGIYRLVILDPTDEPVADGCCGEIAVAGIGGLARGYCGNPRLTATRFVPNAWPLVPGERLYLTGDLGFRNWLGAIEMIGRRDAQVKVRGCRVEPEEVERLLRSHPGVSACAVVADRNLAGGTMLAAYYVGGADAADLDVLAQAHLPDFMRPSAYVTLAALALTASGKLDREKLPRIRPEDQQFAPRSEPPAPGLESEVAAIWNEVLGERTIGRTDSFFAIGGDSLSAIHVISRLRRRFLIDLSVRDFFARPNISELAAFLDSRLVALVSAMSETDLTHALTELTDE